MPAKPTHPDAMPAAPKINPTYSSIPLPAGAQCVEDWTRPHGRGRMPNVYRGFTGTSQIIEHDRAIEVQVIGWQRLDGNIRREVCVSEIDDSLTLATGRQLGAELIAAADEAEEMASYDRIT
jgi:hypothetical protein